MHRMLSQRNCRSDASKLRSASPQTTFCEVANDSPLSMVEGMSLAACSQERENLTSVRAGEICALKRLDDILHVYPLVGGHALQNDGRQPPFDPGMQRDGHSLKPGI
jgi:hypothetical protein